MNLGLRDRVAIVTGASRGMGFATRIWYAGGRTAVWAHPEPCVRGLAEWGREKVREWNGTDRRVALFRPN